MNKNRLKLGILFNFDSSWMGGIIYIINLVKTLDFLEDDEKPEIYLFFRSDLKRFLDEFDYPYLHPIEWNFPKIIQGNVKSWILRRNIFIEDILRKYPLDSLYPVQDFPLKAKTKVKLISWSPDFQHKHYPEFFSKKQKLGRVLRVRLIIKNNNDLVLSSYDAKKDLENFFKIRNGINIHIYHFVSIIDNEDSVPDIEELKQKYSIPDKYFLISNQFHKHKNHRVVFSALAKLKNSGVKKYVAITGKLPDAEDSPYLEELHEIINKNNLHDQIKILGIISRKDQLQLMKHSQAVIQPSLFEGWSTVIEDARSLQVPVIASNLNVNIEQLGKTGTFFDPHNSDALAQIIKDYPDRNFDVNIYEDYPSRVKKAANELMNIFQPG